MAQAKAQAGNIDTTTLPPLIPTTIAAALLSVTPHMVRNMCHSGKIKAVGLGTCCIYAYAQNGKFAKCKVTVKK